MKTPPLLKVIGNPLPLIILLFYSYISCAQEVVKLPLDQDTNLEYSHAENEYYSDDWETRVITNVSVPELVIYKPDNPGEHGMAVVIAPGGGYYALSIEKEGRQVAQWLAERGVVAGVLKYRLVPTGEDGVKDLTKEWNSVEKRVKSVQPLAMEDGLNAIKYFRENAASLKIDPEKIGFMGFSAGGDVTVNVGLGYEEESKPNFIVPVYAWMPGKEMITPRDDAAPLLVICASDDPLNLAPGNTKLYLSWLEGGHSASMIMYAKGGHGFGMQPQALPSDNWIERFYEWSLSLENPQN